MAKARIYSNEFTLHNNVTLVRGGIDYFDRIVKIADAAQHILHLQTYIFDNDSTGQFVAAALKRAAQRGVKVYILLDGFASKGLTQSFIKDIESAGVHFAFFKQLYKSDLFYLGRRLHHKIIVADGWVCMTAGINISNRYNDVGETKAWLDWAIYTEGEVATQINELCTQMWNRNVLRIPCAPMPANAIHMPPLADCEVRIRRNDWVHRKTEITHSYRVLFREAHQYVTIMTSYFWPPQNLLRQMARATARGVKVRVILTGSADVPFVKYTERYLYNFLFRHKIEVYEYNRNILHGKLAVSDDKWLTLGSYNMNNISAFASVELNLEVKNAGIAKDLNQKLQQLIDEDCTLVKQQDYRLITNPIKSFFYFLSHKIIHLIFYIFTIYFRQKKWQD